MSILKLATLSVGVSAIGQAPSSSLESPYKLRLS
jgi:hypothetical protein